MKNYRLEAWRTAPILLFALFVNPTLQSQVDLGPLVEVSTDDRMQLLPSLAYNSLDDEFLVTHSDESGLTEIRGTRLSPRGEIFHQFLIQGGDRDRVGSPVAFNPSQGLYLTVWQYDYHGDASDWDIRGRLMPVSEPTGSLVEFPISQWTSHQTAPRVVFNPTGGEFLVVWDEIGSPFTRPYGQRLRGDDGTPVGPPFELSTASANQDAVDVAYSEIRNEYFAVYRRDNSTHSDIWGQRISAAGSRLGEFEIANSIHFETNPRISASKAADLYLVTWSVDNSAGDEDVRARRIAGDGAPLGGDFVVGATSVNENYPSVAAHRIDDQFLVVWAQQYSSTTGRYGIRGRLVNSNGNLSESFDPIPVYTGQTASSSFPAAVSGPSGWMTTWQHHRDGSPWMDIHGRYLRLPIMSDGFESGDLSAWSATSP